MLRADGMLAFIAAQQKYFAQLDCVELELEADSEDDGEVEETSISPDDVVRASLRDTAKLEPEADDAKLLAADEDGANPFCLPLGATYHVVHAEMLLQHRWG